MQRHRCFVLQYYSNEDTIIVSLLKQLGMGQHKYQFTRGIATTNRYVGAQTHQKKIYKLDYESCHVYDNYWINIDFDFLMPGVSIATGAWAILNRWNINGYYFK